VTKFLVITLMGLAAVPCGARAEAQAPCPGNPEALATSRVLAVDVAATPRVGRKHFPATLPLADKEVVLSVPAASVAFRQQPISP
jgi:peptidoglycan-N-acetylglucosamine deacetylase